jgi:hypothetical protein
LGYNVGSRRKLNCGYSITYSSELIPSTLLSVLHEIPKDKDRARERTVFWDWDADTNIMPLKDLEGGWWFASWDLKVSCRAFVTLACDF